jgi:hypothetical protein
MAGTPTCGLLHTYYAQVDCAAYDVSQVHLVLLNAAHHRKERQISADRKTKSALILIILLLK